MHQRLVVVICRDELGMELIDPAAEPVGVFLELSDLLVALIDHSLEVLRVV
jgi:hypothetical protein